MVMKRRGNVINLIFINWYNKYYIYIGDLILGTRVQPCFIYNAHHHIFMLLQAIYSLHFVVPFYSDVFCKCCLSQ